MHYSIRRSAIAASRKSEPKAQMRSGRRERLAFPLTERATRFFGDEPNPAAVLAFERDLADEMRQLGRQIVEQVYNQLEPDEPESLPHYVHHEAGEYRRLNRKTPNREVATLFGKITLWRHGYRYVERGVDEPTIFPLEIQLAGRRGHACLGHAAARALAETGATQDTALARLRSQHGVVWGVKKLRAVAENAWPRWRRFAASVRPGRSSLGCGGKRFERAESSGLGGGPRWDHVADAASQLL